MITKDKLSIVDCEELLKIIMDSKEYTERKGQLMEKLYNQIQNHKIIGKSLRRFIDYSFNNIDCMVSEDGETLGFFKSVDDVRPSQATYITKKDAEHLYNVFIASNEIRDLKKALEPLQDLEE